MPQVTFDATELQGPKVDFVSLVKRGANRIPFRITKEDEPMLDLGSLRRRIFNKADPVPEIVAVVAGEQASLASAAALLKSAGLYDVDRTVVKDGLHLLTKSDAPDGTAISMPGDVAVVVSNFAKDFGFAAPGIAPDFEERLIVSGFSISACMATDLLSDAVVTALASANSPADAAQQLTAVIDVYRSYVLALAGALPSAVSKADAALYKAAKDAKGAKKPGEQEPDGDECGADKMKKGEQIADKPVFGNDTQSGAIGTGDGNIDGNPTYGNETPKGKQKTKVGGNPNNDIEGSNQDEKNRVTKGDAGAVEKAASDADVGQKGKGNKLPEDKSGSGTEEGNGQTEATVKKSDVDAMMSLLTEFQKSVTGAIDVMKTDLSSLSGRVDAVVGQVQKAETALRGTVLGEAGSDPEHRPNMRKSDGGDLPLLDTGFDRRAVA